MGGQCIDSLAEQFPRLGNDAKYSEIMDLWKSYHLKPITQIPEDVVKRINEIIEKGYEYAHINCGSFRLG